MVGVPGLLEKVKYTELRAGKRIFELDNVSRRPISSDGFVHVPVKGKLEVEVTSEGIFATVDAGKVTPDEHLGDPEGIKRKMNSAYKEEITGANDYVPGKRVTLYSYPRDHSGWSFHCKLEE